MFQTNSLLSVQSYQPRNFLICIIYIYIYIYIYIFAFLGWSETESTCYVGHYLTYCTNSAWWWWWWWWWWVWSNRWNDWQEKPKYSEKTCLSVTLSTTNPTLSSLESYLGCRSRRLTARAMALPSERFNNAFQAPDTYSDRTLHEAALKVLCRLTFHCHWCLLLLYPLWSGKIHFSWDQTVRPRPSPLTVEAMHIFTAKCGCITLLRADNNTYEVIKLLSCSYSPSTSLQNALKMATDLIWYGI
jgi:hypothetical protein